MVITCSLYAHHMLIICSSYAHHMLMMTPAGQIHYSSRGGLQDSSILPATGPRQVWRGRNMCEAWGPVWVTCVKLDVVYEVWVHTPFLTCPRHSCHHGTRSASEDPFGHGGRGQRYGQQYGQPPASSSVSHTSGSAPGAGGRGGKIGGGSSGDLWIHSESSSAVAAVIRRQLEGFRSEPSHPKVRGSGGGMEVHGQG